MTLHRTKGGLIHFECNRCGEILDTNETEFFFARDVMRGENWKTYIAMVAEKDLKPREPHTVWEHLCDRCAKK